MLLVAGVLGLWVVMLRLVSSCFKGNWMLFCKLRSPISSYVFFFFFFCVRAKLQIACFFWIINILLLVTYILHILQSTAYQMLMYMLTLVSADFGRLLHIWPLVKANYI